MALEPTPLKQYYVFLSSPSDVEEERKVVRRFFERYNRHTGELLGVRFEIVDWENYATIGVGAPQELITKQTLDRYKGSLSLVIGIMGQRFGSPTGNAESGTEAEFRWALNSFQQSGFPEIKWFFRQTEQFVAPPDLESISAAAAQWQKVQAFREELKNIPVFFAEYKEPSGFKEAFEKDVARWLQEPARPWIAVAPTRGSSIDSLSPPPDAYLEIIEREFHRLDIAGIDNDRAFEIPLSEIYVRLRVMFDDDDVENESEKLETGSPIDIQTALLRYRKLVIVGDPGSGKSTFLKYVALMLARSMRTNDSSIALEKLCLQEPLPLPIFVSCWDLSDFLKNQPSINLRSLLHFLVERLTATAFAIDSEQLDRMLSSGSCFLLFDGLDEVPTDAGRAGVSRLIEDCVKQYGTNRYLITSRVRAYTGDTILKGQFARADIQPFNASDRAQFLRNWVALLFKIAPADVDEEVSEAQREFQSVTRGIEANDRIRPLAVNPLLLTVIAIVHWNRKRLPEQRNELYDECVDVLLGQRKEAEHVQLTRRTASLDQHQEQEQFEERAWVRKRFGEIALNILSSGADRDETSRAEIVKLLAPRFLDQGATSQELAETRASYFLERQELSSGLLVSRREQSYRFVHLTFQEYLAAWHLSNQDFDRVVAEIVTHLRQQKWFETLQLLGGEWAKQSDDKVDRYIAWLLDRQGDTITERAPVIALCANIVKDITGIAELTQQTRTNFRGAVERTLDAFRPSSGVPAITQLEILEALGSLGAAVKPHLIAATNSSLFQVRRRAIEILLPHLSDDELFELRLLSDRSKQPIKAFLLCLVNRDPARTEAWLLDRKDFSYKATDAFAEVLGEFKQALSAESFLNIVRHVFVNGSSYYGWYGYPSRADLLREIDDAELLRRSASEDREPGVRAKAIELLASKIPTDSTVWDLVSTISTNDLSEAVRVRALNLLVTRQKEVPATWKLITQAAENDQHHTVRVASLQILAHHKKEDAATWRIMRAAATTSQASTVRSMAIRLLAEGQPNPPETWQCLFRVAEKDQDPDNRKLALELLWKRLDRHPQICELLARVAVSDSNDIVRKWAFFHVATKGLTDLALQLLSRDLDGLLPGALDPQQQISHEQVAIAAAKLKLPEQRIRETFAEIARKVEQNTGIALNLEW